MNIAIITGASSGMGREAALWLAERCPHLDEIWVIARRMERLVSLKQQLDKPVRPFALDLCRQEELLSLQRALEEEQPRVRFLVNAAGFGTIGTIEAMDKAKEQDMITLNCQALCAVTRLVLPYLSKNSRILQFASAAAFLPQPNFAVYAATKAFVLSYSRALGAELKEREIYVTAVCPGPVRTEFFDIAEQTGSIPFYKRLAMARPERVVKKAMRDSAMRRPLSVYGIAMKGVWLLSRIAPHGVLIGAMGLFSGKQKKKRQIR